MLAGILAVRYAESKLEIKGLEQPVSKEVPFYHPEVIDRPGSYQELNRSSDGFQLEKLWRELIPYEASRVRILRSKLFAVWLWFLVIVAFWEMYR